MSLYSRLRDRVLNLVNRVLEAVGLRSSAPKINEGINRNSPHYQDPDQGKNNIPPPPVLNRENQRAPETQSDSAQSLASTMQLDARSNSSSFISAASQRQGRDEFNDPRSPHYQSSSTAATIPPPPVLKTDRQTTPEARSEVYRNPPQVKRSPDQNSQAQEREQPQRQRPLTPAERVAMRNQAAVAKKIELAQRGRKESPLDIKAQKAYENRRTAAIKVGQKAHPVNVSHGERGDEAFFKHTDRQSNPRNINDEGRQDRINAHAEAGRNAHPVNTMHGKRGDPAFERYVDRMEAARAAREAKRTSEPVSGSDAMGKIIDKLQGGAGSFSAASKSSDPSKFPVDPQQPESGSTAKPSPFSRKP